MLRVGENSRPPSNAHQKLVIMSRFQRKAKTLFTIMLVRALLPFMLPSDKLEPNQLEVSVHHQSLEELASVLSISCFRHPPDHHKFPLLMTHALLLSLSCPFPTSFTVSVSDALHLPTVCALPLGDHHHIPAFRAYPTPLLYHCCPHPQ